MASLRPPGLGPVVGATTDTTCRIWIRAGDPGDSRSDLDEDRRTVGIIGMLGRDNKIAEAWYFRLQREFDRTGTFLIGSDVQLGFYPQDFKDQIDSGQLQGFPSSLPPEAIPVPLTPDTAYTVRCGTLTIDDPLPNAATLADWELIRRLPLIDNIKQELLGPAFKAEECEASFRTFPAAAAGQVEDRMSFLLGSCRYPGLLWKIKEADRIFGPMQEHFSDSGFGKAARYTVMCGDQIYADMLNRMVPILRADSFDEFQQRYLAAYGAPNLRGLLRRATTYMILDDHEIEDNWTQDRIHEGKLNLFNIAIGAYQSYQWSHSPRTFGRLFYYTFECGGYPTFVLDTRTQRFKDDQVGLRDNHMLGRPTLDPDNHPGQLRRLCVWLSEQQKTRGNVPKFIVTSSVFVPNDMGERIAFFDDSKPGGGTAPPKSRIKPEDQIYGDKWNSKRRDDSDSWPAYPNTRLELLKHIVDNKIQNVVFLAGDIHCSNTAVIDFDGDAAAKKLKAFSVTSSAFYWPFPFADGDPNNYVHDSRQPEQSDPFPILGTDKIMHYKSFGYSQEDNFTRLDLDKSTATLTVRVFGRDGKLATMGDGNKATPIQHTLQLAKWG
ncbi:alkaline phosphatase D family protein [Tardiphaga sp.]|uniref:alkaline phosphatase D family protein n=1 Tax=Tardiphaga sp. TaxID=1926292 RepID=UPI0025D86E75|nr:alkaline phosphatase D family protein [Tardiphaga sp.]